MLIDGVLSDPTDLDCGVPQGSILGPILFTLYASPLEDIILRHALDLMLFADDTQLYLTCKRAVNSSFLVEECLDEIRSWMVDNRLVLNESKTEVIHIRSGYVRKTMDLKSLRVGDVQVETSTCIRDLGAYFNNRGTMVDHVSKHVPIRVSEQDFE